MRTISSDNAAILAAGARAVTVRMSVADSVGTLRDLTSYPGVDMVEELSWGEALDSEGFTWSATLVREQRLISLAPLVAASPLNRGFNPTASYAPLLQVGRKMRIEYSMQAAGDPRARTWATAFDGYIDTIDAAAGDNVKLTGRGLETALINAFIKRERVYAFAQGAYATKGAYVWPDPAKGTAYTTFAVGDLMLPTGSRLNGHFYRATSITTGVVAATEPVWPTGGGSTVVDGGVTWTESGTTSTSVGTLVETVMQQILNDNVASPPTLWCPTSPGWAVQWFLVSRQSAFAELKALADQIGWCLRYMDSAGTPSLKFFDPLRSTTTSLRVFTPSKDYDEPTKLAVDWKMIRNDIRVVFSDSQDLDAAKNPKRKALTVTDAASVTKYSDLFSELAESSTGNIDTVVEATALANNVLSDLSEPTADMQIPLLYLFAFIEIADLYTFAADGVRFDSDQKLAVVSYSHLFSRENASTSISVRGKPASNSAAGWFAQMSDSVGGESHRLTAIENVVPIALAADTTPVGGARLSFDWAGAKSPMDTQFELHLSKNTGFVPSSSTLAQVGKERSFEVGNLDPAFQYYAVVVPVTWNSMKPVRGSPSVQLPFTPGRGQATHLNPNVEWGRLPLNGGFETQLDPTALPDFWFLVDPAQWNGPSGTGGLVSQGTSNGVSGANYLKLQTTLTTDSVQLYSSEFTLNELESYVLKMWKKCVTGSGNNLDVEVVWYDLNHGQISRSSTLFSLAAGVGSWAKITTGTLTPAAGARFGRVYVAVVAGASGREVHIDSVEFIKL